MKLPLRNFCVLNKGLYFKRFLVIEDTWNSRLIFRFLIMAHASSGIKGAIFSDMKCIAALNNLLFETKMDIVIVKLENAK